MISGDVVEQPKRLSSEGRLGFLLKDSVIYGFAGTVSKALALVTFPLLTRHFSVVEYGSVSFFSTFVTFVAILAVFGQDTAVARYFYEYEDRPSRVGLISESLVVQIGLSVIIGIALFLEASRIVKLVHDVTNADKVVRLIALQLPFIVALSFSQNLLKWTFDRFNYLLVSVGSIVLNMVLIIVGVTYLDISLTGLFRLTLVVNVFFGTLGLVLVRKWLIVPRGLKWTGRMARYAVPFGLVCSIAAFVPTYERIYIGSQFGGSALGTYSAGAAIAMLMSLFIGAFRTAWGPFSLSLYREENAVGTYNLVLSLWSTVLCLGSLAFSAMSPALLGILASKKYEGAWLVVFPLSLALSVEGLGIVTELGISLSKKTYLKMVSFGSFLIVAPLAMLILGKTFGPIGVGFGVLMGQACRILVASFLSSKAYPMNWSFSGSFWLVNLTLVLGLAGILTGVRMGPVWGSGVFGISFFAAAFFAWRIVLDDQQRKIVIELVATGGWRRLLKS